MESAGITDREKAGLRGPVRTNVEEAVYPTGKFFTATEFSLDGKLLTTRTSSTDGSEWLTTQTYDANGQLVKIASGQSGEPGTESLYSYDETGRLLNITNHPQKGSRIDFRYDGQGRKTAMQTFDAETLQRARNAIFAGSAWDAAVGTGIGVPAGGKITTSYDENEQPTEAQILDAEGRVVTRFLRIYDSNGQHRQTRPSSLEPVSRSHRHAPRRRSPAGTHPHFPPASGSTTHRSSDHSSRDHFLESFFDLPLTAGRNDRRSRTPAKPQPKYEQRYERSRGIE